jgi:hypothetical protein
MQEIQNPYHPMIKKLRNKSFGLRRVEPRLQPRRPLLSGRSACRTPPINLRSIVRRQMRRPIEGRLVVSRQRRRGETVKKISFTLRVVNYEDVGIVR